MKLSIFAGPYNAHYKFNVHYKFNIKDEIKLSTQIMQYFIIKYYLLLGNNYFIIKYCMICVGERYHDNITICYNSNYEFYYLG